MALLRRMLGVEGLDHRAGGSEFLGVDVAGRLSTTHQLATETSAQRNELDAHVCSPTYDLPVGNNVPPPEIDP